MADYRLKTKAGLRKKPRYTKVTREKIEYYYANMFFLYTIGFLIICSFLNLGKYASDYMTSVMISQVEYTLPLIAYLYIARQNIDVVNGERVALTSVCNRLNLHKLSILKLLISVVIGVAIIPFLSLINRVSIFLVKDVTTNKAADAAAKNPMWLMLLIVCIIPPIVEELTYRGVYFTAYKRAGIMKGALLSAFIFALMHGNLNQFAYAIVAGFIFAMITYAGGSILCTIIVHIIINASSIITLYYDKTGFKFPSFIVNSTTYNSLKEAFSDMWLAGLIGLIIVAFCYFLLRLLSEREMAKLGTKTEANIDTTTRIIDAPLIFGVAIMLANMIANEFIQ